MLTKQSLSATNSFHAVAGALSRQFCIQVWFVPQLPRQLMIAKQAWSLLQVKRALPHFRCAHVRQAPSFVHACI